MTEWARRVLLIWAAALTAGLALPTARLAAQPPQWDVASVRELLDAIEGARAEGLDPRDYDPEPLRQALAQGPGPTLSALAAERFRHLARDYVQGHVGPEDRIGWHIAGPTLTNENADVLMARALSERRIGPLLAEQLPSDGRYVGLRAALAATPASDPARVEAIRVNMERWRWLPRDLGRRRIEVNVPGFTLSLMADGKPLQTHRVIVGKPSTPTPQFSTLVEGVIFNPWWDVPKSIVAESVGTLLRTRPSVAQARGYIWSGGSVRQRPGPGNALGQMKLVMPNPFSVYVHDTPAKTLFDRPVRALSHGCIRTQDPFGLATALLGDRTEIDRIAASGDTTRRSLAEKIPAYVFYFTAELDEAGRLVIHPDLYGRDRVVAAELVDRDALDGVG